MRDSQDSMVCNECNYKLHLQCSVLKKSEFKKYTQNRIIYLCQYCMYYKCGQCKHHVYEAQNKISCTKCNILFHLKCTNITKNRFLELKNNPDLTWLCKPCHENEKSLFPFYRIDNNSLRKLFSIKDIYEKKIEIFLNNHQTISKQCSVCYRNITQPKKAVPCKTCIGLVHRKCSGLKTISILEFFNSNIFQHWECPSCMHTNFPFYKSSDIEIKEQSFNSNFNCYCKTNSNYLHKSNSHVFNFNIEIDNNDKQFSAEPDTFNHGNSYNIICDFDYYNTHDIHKLTKKSVESKDFSIFHSNICSLQGNFEKLELLLTNLDYHFNIIALTETWNPNEKMHNFNPGNLEGYQSYEGLSGSSLKSGCGFYIQKI